MKQYPKYKLDKSIMKDKMGKYRTISLFYELNDTEYPSIFNLGDSYDPVTKTHSFKEMYLSIGDPTEYKMADQLFGTITHWQRVCLSTHLREFIAECRMSLKMSILSDAYHRILNDTMVSENDGVRLSSLKFLIGYMERGEGEKGPGRGRPSRDEVDGELKRLAAEEKGVKDDIKRLTVVKGGKPDKVS